MGEYAITKVPLDAYDKVFPSKKFSRMPILYLEMIENKSKVRKEFLNKQYVPIPSTGTNTTTSPPEGTMPRDGGPKGTVQRSDHSENDPSADPIDLLEDETRRELRDEEDVSKESKIEDQLNSLLGEDVEEDKEARPPTLEELQQKKKIKLNREYRYADEDDEETQKERNAVYFKYEVLRRMHPNAHIPEFTMYSDPKIMGQKYELLTKKLSLDSSVDNWKRYMIIFVMGCEVVLGKMKFDMEGFAQQQIMSMSTYDQLLVEMAEKSYVPTGQSKWSPEIRLFMMLTMNIVLFVVSRMIFKSTGANLLGTINDLSSPQQPSDRKMKEPE